MSHINRSSFVKSILTQNHVEHDFNTSLLKSTLLESNLNVTLVTKLAVMMMIFENSTGSIEDKIKHISESFEKVLSIICEHKLILPEEECIIEKILKDIQEEGEVSAPTNSVSGIEPTTPRISPRKNKKTEEDDNGIFRD